MVGIRKRHRELIVEHRGGFSEIDVMVLEIGRRFRRVPCNNHEASIASSIGNPLSRDAPGVAERMDAAGELLTQTLEPPRSCRLFGLVEADEPREVLKQFGR